MSKGTICYVGNGIEQVNLIRNYSEKIGYDFAHVNNKQDMFNAADTLKYAKMVFIWNPHHHIGPLVTRMCRERRIPCVYIEQGMLPQDKTYFIDPMGFNGNSILNHDLSWVNDEDMKRLRRERKQLQREYPLTDEGFVLVPLQIHNDTQILYHTPYNNMKELVEYVQYLFPGRQLIARPHPKSGSKNERYKGVKSIYEGTFLNCARRASVVVGATSTCLYEAAILGKPVLALGNHPLRGRTVKEIDLILAGALALRINRVGGDLTELLQRFGIRPLP